MRAALLAFGLTIASTCSFAVAIEADTAPYLTIRSLEALQDRITEGDSLAAAAHAKAIARTAAQFAKAKPAVWGDERNARALVLYLFSGGNAAAIGAAVARDSVAKGQQTLYDGALAYGLAHDDDARDKLVAIDARTLPSSLGGHLALVQAALLAGSDNDKAIERLDLARLLEPGTLVEEAALRKEMMLLGAKGDAGKFALLARRYASAFHKSLYADNFRQLAKNAALQAAAQDTAEACTRLSTLTASLDAADRRQLYLSIAREALIAGRLRMATFASEEVGHLPGLSDGDLARAKLYGGAATVVGPRYDQAHKALTGVGAAKLDDKDEALRQSALAIADMIRNPSFASRPEPGATQAATLVNGEDALTASNDIMARAPK